jgi:hypothetical protein
MRREGNSLPLPKPLSLTGEGLIFFDLRASPQAPQCSAEAYCCEGGVDGFCVEGAGVVGFAVSTGAGGGVVGAGDVAGAGVALAGGVAPGAGVVVAGAVPGAGVVVADGLVVGFAGAAGAAGRGGAWTPLTTEPVPR